MDLVDAPLLLLARDPAVILGANAAAQELLGPQRFQSLPRSLEAVIGGYALRRLEEALAAAPPDGPAPRTTIECLGAAGRQHLVFSLRRPPELPAHWLVTLSNAGAPPSGEWRRDLVQILDLLPVGIEIYDEDMSALFYNAFSDQLFSYEEKAVLHYDEWWDLGFPDPAERARAVAQWRERVAAARADPAATQTLELWVLCRDRLRRRVQFRFRFVGDKLVLLILDVTEQRQLEEELRRLADSDPLTGLCNRRFFLAEAEARFAEAEAPLALLMLDLDHFKTINDRFGHPTGDEVLRALAGRLHEALRAQDLVARLGGEEFAVLLEGLSAAEALAVAERLRAAATREPVAGAAGALVPVSLSIGLALRRPEDATLQALLQRADRALYAAKAAGRDRVLLA